MVSTYQRKSGRWDSVGKINGRRRHFQGASAEIAEARYETAFVNEEFIPNQTPVEKLILPTPRKFATVGFDLETTNLNANFGQILAACVKPVGGETITFRLDELMDPKKPWDDTPLVLALCNLLNQCGKVFGWYSSEFDVKYLRTRKLLNNLQFPVVFAHADLWRTAKGRLSLHNNRLDTWSRSFAPQEHQKTAIDWECWRRAAFGDKVSMDYVVKHCEEDVAAMEYSFLHLDPYIGSWQQEVL